MIFLVLLERCYFFPGNMVFFPWTKNERAVTFLKKYSETWYFLFDMFHASLLKKIKYHPTPQKYTWKWLIEIPDRHPRKSSSNSLYLHGDLCRRFHILISSKKNKKNRKLNIQDWSLTFSSSFYSVGGKNFLVQRQIKPFWRYMQKFCESNQNCGSYEQKETTYFKEAFLQVSPLR